MAAGPAPEPPPPPRPDAWSRLIIAAAASAPAEPAATSSSSVGECVEEPAQTRIAAADPAPEPLRPHAEPPSGDPARAPRPVRRPRHAEPDSDLDSDLARHATGLHSAVDGDSTMWAVRAGALVIPFEVRSGDLDASHDASLPDLDDWGDEEPPTPFAWFAMLSQGQPAPSAERNLELARRIEAGEFAHERLVDEWENLARRDRRELRLVARCGQMALNELVRSNIRLAFHFAKSEARRHGLDLVQDAFQAALIGLFRGIQGWDPERGALSTYATWHIRQQIQRWSHNEVDVIRLPVHVHETLAKDPSELTPQVRLASERAQKVASLEGFAERGEEVIDDELERMEDDLDRKMLHASVARLLEELSDRERDVVMLRHGFGDGRPKTLEEIGDVFGLTRERIRQIEKQACGKLREKVDAAGGVDAL